MRKLEIQARSMDEAKMIAFQSGITIIQDVTKDWKKAGCPLLTRDISIFAADFLEHKHMFDFKDAGIVITIDKGVPEGRMKPAILTSKRRKGRCKLTRILEIRTQKDDTLIGTASNKTKAIVLAKKLLKKCKESVYGKTIYTSADIDFELKYTPPINTKMGQYIIFAVDEGDVRISKRKYRGFE